MATATAGITKAEFSDRVSKVQAEMAKQGIDVLINYDEDRNLGAAGVRNLIGFNAFPSPIPGVVVVGLEGEPILCMQLSFTPTSRFTRPTLRSSSRNW
jgi:hypothetical protein